MAQWFRNGYPPFDEYLPVYKHYFSCALKCLLAHRICLQHAGIITILLMLKLKEKHAKLHEDLKSKELGVHTYSLCWILEVYPVAARAPGLYCVYVLENVRVEVALVLDSL